MNEVSDNQMRLDVEGALPHQKIKGPNALSSETAPLPYRIATRDPSIPVKLRGMKEPKIIPVRIHFSDPRDRLGDYRKLEKGRIQFFPWKGDKSKLSSNSYLIVNIEDALIDPETGEKPGQELTDLFKNHSLWIHVEDIAWEEEKTSKSEEKISLA
jgi:hypothetical protein